jgi:hypothetical protein
MSPSNDYQTLQTEIAELLRNARLSAVRSVNAVMTASYWEVGRRIVESEQKGSRRAAYSEQLLKQLSTDLTAQFGRGFGYTNLTQMRQFYRLWSPDQILQTLSEEFSPRANLPHGANDQALCVGGFIQSGARCALSNLVAQHRAIDPRVVQGECAIGLEKAEMTNKVQPRGFEIDRGFLIHIDF